MSDGVIIVLGFVAGVLFIVGIVAVAMLLPAYLLMLSTNWLAPQFGSQFHLAFWQAWVGLFALGIVGRALRGPSK